MKIKGNEFENETNSIIREIEKEGTLYGTIKPKRKLMLATSGYYKLQGI